MPSWSRQSVPEDRIHERPFVLILAPGDVRKVRAEPGRPFSTLMFHRRHHTLPRLYLSTATEEHELALQRPFFSRKTWDLPLLERVLESASPVSDWISYRDDDSGLGLELPADWQVADGVAGSELTVLAPELGVEGFVANVTVTVQELEAPVELEGYSAAVLETMGRVLTDARLVDREGTTLLGRAGERVLVAYRQGIHSLALEQWWSVAATADEGGAVVVSATCAALDYDTYADTFNRIAGSLTVDGA